MGSWVPLRDYVDLQVKGLRRELEAIDRLHHMLAAEREKATRVAFDAANEKGVHHNGLIDRMREMSKQYVTWPVVLLLIGLALSLSDRVWGDATPVAVVNPPSAPVPVVPTPEAKP